jgi:lipopolysaccharide/colanic/teichoic acid biosynthesis glycosyltransferase
VGRGVLFRQERLGLDGGQFTMVKFRTLGPALPGEHAGWSVVEDHRIGPVGRLLRRSSLDELPQLWNVLRGEMSLVGPRPEQPQYVQQFARTCDGYSARHRVPVGITGLAQIHDLRGDTSITQRVRLDNYYIEHWSFWQDIKILVRTVTSVFGMRGG